MPPPFSDRTSWDSSESSYASAVRALRASGRPLFDLTLANPAACGFRYDQATILPPLADGGALMYDPDPRGILRAREAVALYYADHGASVDPSQLLLTTSTSESYSFLFRLLANPGDEILAAQPGYPLFDFLATLDDVRLRTYTLLHDHGWWIDFAELERAITPRTRAIVVVHPNNPTGHWTSPAERPRLEALCLRHDLALIVDEVFLDYPVASEQPRARSFARGPHPVLTLVLSGISKIAGLPQMKAAWIAVFGPDAVRAGALDRLEIVADTFLSVSMPTQLALPAWLASRAPIQRQIIERVRLNLATLYAHPGLHALPVDAGWNAILTLPACVGEVDCAERLVRERAVVTHPGSFYGMPARHSLVVSLIVPPDDFAAGLERLYGWSPE